MDQLLNVLILLGVTLVLAAGLRRPAGTTGGSVNWAVPMGSRAEGRGIRRWNNNTTLVVVLLLCVGVLALVLIMHPGVAFAAGGTDNVNWCPGCPH